VTADQEKLMLNRSTRRRYGHTVLSLSFFAGFTAGCLPATATGVAGVPAYQAVTVAGRRAGESIPAPQGETVLTLTGAIGTTNSGAELRLDLETLEQFGLVQFTVVDPWQNRSTTFAGVLLADLLKYAGVAPTATTLHLVALDDYQANITLADIRKWPILLATRADGGRPSIADGGPTRIVFPYQAFPQIDTSIYNPQWVWSLKTIDVQ
jgi:hypothetical protein